MFLSLVAKKSAVLQINCPLKHFRIQKNRSEICLYFFHLGMKKMQGVGNILLEKETLYKMKTASCTKKHVFNISICHIPRNE